MEEAAGKKRKDKNKDTKRKKVLFDRNIMHNTRGKN